MRVHRFGVAVAIVFLVSTPATAATSSSASIGPLTVQFFDLDPTDGVTPTIVFGLSSYGVNNHVGAFASQSNTAFIDSKGALGAEPWAPAVVTAGAGVTHATASIDGADTFAGTSLSASGSATDFTSAILGDTAQYSGNASAPYSQYATSTNFTLSAHSIVVISANASVAAAVTGHVNGEAEFARAEAYIIIGGVAGGGGGTQSSSDALRAGYGANLGAPFSETSNRLISVSFVNNTGGDLSGNLSILASAFGTTYATPVPEPQSFWLTLAGLFAVEWARRRRQA
jgi:hypothetical protein